LPSEWTGFQQLLQQKYKPFFVSWRSTFAVRSSSADGKLFAIAIAKDIESVKVPGRVVRIA